MTAHRTWNEVKAAAAAARVARGATPDQENARQVASAARVADMVGRSRAYRLGEMRRELGLTQQDVAAAMGVGQSWVSQFEGGEVGAAGVDTVRRYVEALGGHLEIIANFGEVRLLAS